jgi:hypothetical protein
MTLNLGATSGNTTTVTVTPMNGFSGPVTLACAVTGTFPILVSNTVPQCNVPSPVNVSGGKAATVTATLNSQSTDGQGFYMVTIIAIDPGSGMFGIDNTIDLLLIASPSFVLKNGGNIQIAAGASSTTSITVAPANGFTGMVNLTCKVNPDGFNPTSSPGCSLSPASVTVSSSTTPGSTLTVTSVSGTSGAAIPGARPSRLGAVAALAIVLLFGLRGKRRAWMRILGLLVLLLGMAAPGCGGGGGSGSGGGGGGGTTPGNYAVVVTGTDAATGKITAQTTVSVTVN